MEQFNLTEGVISKTLVRYSLPIVLSSLLQSAYAITDMVLAGMYIGKTGISGITNSSQILLMLTQVMMGITMGAGILISQYYGAKDRENRVQTNITLFSISLLFGLIAMLLMWAVGKQCLVLLNAPALVEANHYLKICAAGLFPIFGYHGISAMLRAVGNSKQPLYFIAVTSVVNVALDILFMGVFRWGVAGAAWATMIAQSLAFLFALCYILRHKDLFALDLRRLFIKKDKLLTMLKLGIPTSVQMTLVGISWLTMTFLINQYGVEASAASGITAKIKDFALLFTIAMTSSVSTMAGQCIGAEKFDRASRAVHIAMRIAIGVALLLVVLIELTAPQLVSVFKPDAQTAYYAVSNLRIEIIAQIFYASFMVYNALAIGAGHTLFVLGSSVMNSIIARLILAVVLEHFFGLFGIYWACMIAPATSVPLGYIYERSNIWRKTLTKSVQAEE